jgi:hypothetical protein
MLDSAFRPFPTTRWTGYVQARKPDDTRTVGVAVALFEGDTVEAAMAEGFTLASRYLAFGYTATIRGLTEVCSRCDGSGLARPDRNHRYLGRRNPHCPRCGGMGSFRRIGDIAVKPDPSAYLTLA